MGEMQSLVVFWRRRIDISCSARRRFPAWACTQACLRALTSEDAEHRHMAHDLDRDALPPRLITCLRRQRRDLWRRAWRYVFWRRGTGHVNVT